MNILITLLIMLLLLLIKGFFSGSEIALVSSDKIKLRHQARMGNKGAQAVLKLFKTPDVLLGTTLVGTNIATVALTTIGTLLMVEHLGEDGDIYALLLYSPLFLIFGEIVPKSIYQQNATYIAPLIVRVLQFFTWLFYPVIFIFSRTARLVSRWIGGEKSDSSLFISREQMRSIVEMAEMGSNLDVFDRYRIKRAIRFSDTTVGQVMTPVADMIALEKKSSLANALQLAKTMGFRDIPVYDNNISNIVGMLSLSPWAILDLDQTEQKLTAHLSTALFVTENQYLEELFPLLEQHNCHTAIAVDEYGSCIGMIDKMDLFEEVVGDLEKSPTDQSRRRYQNKMLCQELPDGSLLIEGKISMTELNEVLGTKIKSKDYFSLAGLILDHLQHLPTTGETFEDYGYRFSIYAMSERAVKTVKIERLN
jgi:magnesium and cobalt exporter, CNNM family